MGHRPQSIFRRPVVRPARADSVRGSLPSPLPRRPRRAARVAETEKPCSWDRTSPRPRGRVLEYRCLPGVAFRAATPAYKFLANRGAPVPVRLHSAHGNHPPKNRRPRLCPRCVATRRQSSLPSLHCTSYSAAPPLFGSSRNIPPIASSLSTPARNRPIRANARSSIAFSCRKKCNRSAPRPPCRNASSLPAWRRSPCRHCQKSRQRRARRAP